MHSHISSASLLSWNGRTELPQKENEKKWGIATTLLLTHILDVKLRYMQNISIYRIKEQIVAILKIV